MTIWRFRVSKMYDWLEVTPSFLPPKMRISEGEMGQAPNQYLISASRPCE